MKSRVNNKYLKVLIRILAIYLVIKMLIFCLPDFIRGFIGMYLSYYSSGIGELLFNYSVYLTGRALLFWCIISFLVIGFTSKTDYVCGFANKDFKKNKDKIDWIWIIIRILGFYLISLAFIQVSELISDIGLLTLIEQGMLQEQGMFKKIKHYKNVIAWGLKTSISENVIITIVYLSFGIYFLKGEKIIDYLK